MLSASPPVIPDQLALGSQIAVTSQSVLFGHHQTIHWSSMYRARYTTGRRQYPLSPQASSPEPASWLLSAGSTVIIMPSPARPALYDEVVFPLGLSPLLELLHSARQPASPVLEFYGTPVHHDDAYALAEVAPAVKSQQGERPALSDRLLPHQLQRVCVVNAQQVYHAYGLPLHCKLVPFLRSRAVVHELDEDTIIFQTHDWSPSTQIGHTVCFNLIFP